MDYWNSYWEIVNEQNVYKCVGSGTVSNLGLQSGHEQRKN